jgi:hypothetical protein
VIAILLILVYIFAVSNLLTLQRKLVFSRTWSVICEFNNIDIHLVWIGLSYSIVSLYLPSISHTLTSKSISITRQI